VSFFFFRDFEMVKCFFKKTRISAGVSFNGPEQLMDCVNHYSGPAGDLCVPSKGVPLLGRSES
jgi:hypothetical protein